METLPLEKLVKKIQILEADLDHLKQKMSDHQRILPIPPPSTAGEGGGRTSGVKLSERQYLNILESLGQAVHILDSNGIIIYWSKAAENLYGHSMEEALGKFSIELLIDIRDLGEAYNIVKRNMLGQIWTGQFPVKHRSGKRFNIIVNNSPFYDDSGTFLGVITMAADCKIFREMRVPIVDEEKPLQVSTCRSSVTNKFGFEPHQQSMRNKFSSKVAKLASKVSNKVKSKIQAETNKMDSKGGNRICHHPFHDSDSVLDHWEDVNSSRTRIVDVDIPSSTMFGVFQQIDIKAPGNASGDSNGEKEGKPWIHRVITSREEVWIGQKGTSWPWKGNERGTTEVRANGFVLPWLPNDQENVSIPEKCYFSAKPETHVSDRNWPATTEASESWTSPLNIINSPSRKISIRTTRNNALNMDGDTDYSDYEILWEDMIIGGQIGQGSCGTVYHGQWHGSDVAVKLFSRLEYSDDMLHSFKKEVSLMKRLRHPNVLLFMGAVTSPERLCIVTEFLPRGSLFQLLRKNPSKLDWRRRVNMAMDIAWGVNYLHHFTPPIIHRDLKSSNILVDKNWTLKVADFGLSRLKYETFLLTNSGKGTPQWMAPEFLRCEPTDEKSDVYSYGVILWELATKKIPWDNLHPMQVIGAVGFMNQRLEIPKDVDPQWASIIESCWHSNPASRPTFLELLEKLRTLQRQYNLQQKAARSATSDSTQKEE